MNLNQEFENYVNANSVVWQKPETDYWKNYLKNLIDEHFKETQSKIANQILNNSLTSAVLEFTIKGPKIRFHQNTFIALTGAKMKAKLNGIEVDYYVPIKVNEGSILEIGIIQNGCRTYLAVCGGIKTEKILESRSQFKGVTINDRIFKSAYSVMDNTRVF